MSNENVHDASLNANPQKQETSTVHITDDLLEKIRNENLDVYRASIQRLDEDFGQECQIAQDYRGRLVYELLQNADDAMNSGTTSDCIRFKLTDKDLWVANSGRPLDEADVRGLCGISASRKAAHNQKRRATIGHKGMGFKSVLEISDSPEVYSTTICFRFSPKAAVESVQPLVKETKLERISSVPTTRFPCPIDKAEAAWDELLRQGMNTAFRFPLRDDMTTEQHEGLASVLSSLPITSLVFLKHIGRIEVQIDQVKNKTNFAWSIQRQHAEGSEWRNVPGFTQSGDYRIILKPDDGPPESFLLAHEVDIPIEDHRGGLDKFTWKDVEYTEVSVAARMNGQLPIALKDNWRHFHVFLPTGEPCPYDLLVSGAFSSNLSRQEIRVENDATNYNRFLFSQVARILRNRLIPKLLSGGGPVIDCLRLLNRRIEVLSRCATAAAQALYEDVVRSLSDLVFLPGEGDSQLTILDCAVPPIVSDDEVGRSFRKLLAADALCKGLHLPCPDLCGGEIARVLVDHGAHMMAIDEAASLLASANSSKSEILIHPNIRVFVDPVLSVLEQLWRGLGGQEQILLAAAARREALFPVAINDNSTAKRIATQDLTCFYPPRYLHGEVPLSGLCFLMQDICWGDLTPKERNIELQRQMEAWKAIFDIREFKFPEVMRASVLPTLDLDRGVSDRSERSALQNLDHLAAICQLAGRTPNATAPLPYERLKNNRALFNLSRLDVPCRSASSGKVEWVPAYKAYFGIDWIGIGSVENILNIGRELNISGLPNINFLLSPDDFSGLLGRYQYLKSDEEIQEQTEDIGKDEVSIEEDEDASLDADDRERWLRFFQWLGVNASLRPVHFHDVEDRASGWLKTEYLKRPDGWAFKNITDELWNRYIQNLNKTLGENDAKRGQETVTYFYELHDLEHLVAFSNIACTEPSARFSKSLYEHLARHWATLEKFSQVIIAQVPLGQEPGKRNKPPRAKENELVDAGPNFWLFRLLNIPVCPTGIGPRYGYQTWLPSAEVQRRFSRRARVETNLIPTLEVDASILKGKPRAFAQVLGVREELSPSTFTLTDAQLLLNRLYDIYNVKCEANEDLRLDLREVIRPAYRNIVELLTGKEDEADGRSTLGETLILASNGLKGLSFLKAHEVYYLDRRETRERLITDVPIWTFVIENSPAAKIVLARLFGMRVLEDSLIWTPKPTDPAFDDDRLSKFRASIRQLAPYLLARVGVDRADERIARQDARKLLMFIESVEPVRSLDLACSFDGQVISLGEGRRDSFVHISDADNIQAFVVWGENPWPPDQHEAETLASALCDVLGAGYFEAFIALLQAESNAPRDRLLRRTGVPLEVVEEKFALLQTLDEDGQEIGKEDEPSEVAQKTAIQEGIKEEPASQPAGISSDIGKSERLHIPLYKPDDLLIEGVPLIIFGTAPTGENGNDRPHVPLNGQKQAQRGSGIYGGNTDLEELNALGMWVALFFEKERLRRNGLPEATVFDIRETAEQDQARVFDVSKPQFVELARSKSKQFNDAITWLRKFDVVPDWPGFDILTLDTRLPQALDRMIELKSSGIESRVQEMTWNEWKTAKSSNIRDHFYLYLVGNLRSDLLAKPFIRTIRNPFEQITADVQVSHTTLKKVQLAVHEFREAEHRDIPLRRPVSKQI